MSTLRHLPWICLCMLLVPMAEAGDTRFHQYTRRYMEPRHPAPPIAAGYFGGTGDEYLSDAAFLSDGRLLMVGNAYGPAFDPAGVRVRVIGQDTEAPSFTMPTARQGRINPPTWTHTQGAGFIVRLNSDCSTIETVIRLPWGTGTITGIAAGEDDDLYITGIPGEGFTALAGASAISAEDVGGPHDIFIARLRPDLSGFIWAHTLKDDHREAPELSVLNNGLISLIAGNAYHINTDGAIVKATAVPITNSWVRGVDPVTHGFATGGDSHTRTGWEPWRKPVMFIFDDQGQHLFELYRWSEKLVGTNWSRLVSDSETRLLTYDNHGHLLMYGWSDGGNSVFEYAPYDMRTGVRQAAQARTGRERIGLDFSTWGVGVSSIAHLMKIDPATAEPLAKTLFLAYFADRNVPSGASIDMINSATDNSLLIAGRTGFGLIETGSIKVNTLDHNEGHYIGGRFIAVLNETMSDIRFSSALPGGGQVPLMRHSRRYNGRIRSTSRNFGDKTRVAFVGGATNNEHFKAISPSQAAFGGGALDGQYVVLEMDTLESIGPASAERSALKAGTNVGTPSSEEGLTGSYTVSQGMNRHYAVLVMRDTAGERWPLFYEAHPKGDGQVDIDAGSGQFTILGPVGNIQNASGIGHLERRIGARPEEPHYSDLEVAVTLTDASSVDAEIRFNDRRVRVSGPIGIRTSRPSGQGIQIHGVLRTTKQDLGVAIGSEDQDHEVIVEFWVPGR